MDQPLPTTLVEPAAPSPSPSGWSRPPPPAPAPGAGAAFGTGAFIASAFQTWGRGFLQFGSMGLVSSAPMVAGIYLLYSRLPEMAGTGPSMGRLWGFFGFGVFAATWAVSMVLMIVQMGALAHGAGLRLRGERPGMGAMVGAGFRRAPAVLGASFLAGLAIAVGMVLLLVPGIILALGWSAVVPVVVMERAGPFRALRRSWELTRGHRWQLLAGFAVVWLAVMAVAMAVQGATLGLVFATMKPGQPAGAGISLMALPMAIYQLVVGLVSTLFLVASSAAYHGLKTAKEGADPAGLARVFE